MQLFEEADRVLSEELDPMMEIYSTDERDFYNAYNNARVIIDLGYSHSKKEEDSESEN